MRKLIFILACVWLSACFEFPDYQCDKKEQAKFVLTCIKNMRGNDLKEMDTSLSYSIPNNCKDLSRELYCHAED